MTTLDLERLRHLETLAEISLSPEEEEAIAEQLARMVAYAAELSGVDTSNVDAPSPLAHPRLRSRVSSEGWRDDTVNEGLSHSAALAAAPLVAGDGFAVPGFVE